MKRYPKTKASGVDWLGEVPAHWDVKRSDRFVSVDKTQISPDAFSGEVVFLYSIPAVQELGTGQLEEGSSIASAKQVIKEPVVLISKLNPRKATICLAKPQTLLTLCSTEFVPLSSDDCELRFLEYLVQSEAFRQALDSKAQSVTRSHQRANPGDIYKFWSAWPSITEQIAIAKYLDRATGQIDELVGKKRELIERLKEKRTALISRTVTRGLPADLPPETLAKLEQFAEARISLAPSLAPSGLENLTEIPVHWNASRVWLERVSRNLEYQDGNHGELHPKAADYVDDGIPFIMANNLVAGRVDFDSCKKIELELAEKLRIGFAAEGDVLLTHKGTIGRTAIVQENTYPFVMLTPQVTYYRCISGISPDYLFWFFQSKFWQDEMALVSGLGSTRGYVGLLDQRLLPLVLPALPEQRAIATYLDEETAKLDALVAKVETAIERLQEYRTALITAAVTGKIDVREEVVA